MTCEDSILNGKRRATNGSLKISFLVFSVTRLGDLLDFWQKFKAFGNN